MNDVLDIGGVRRLGEELGRTLPPHAVVWLEGPLGAGKTVLARAIAQGRGVASGDIASPTYAIVHRYDGRTGPVYHLDCYRLRTPDDARDLDWDALIDADLLLVEWPERAGSWVPQPVRRVVLASLSDDERTVTIS